MGMIVLHHKVVVRIEEVEAWNVLGAWQTLSKYRPLFLIQLQHDEACTKTVAVEIEESRSGNIKKLQTEELNDYEVKEKEVKKGLLVTELETVQGVG